MSSTFTPSPVQQPPAQPPVRRGAGGTPGGIGTFVLGVVLVAAGGWLITNQVSVTGSFNLFGHIFGGGGFGLTMLPLLVGVGWLFFDGKSVPAWIVTLAGIAMILAAVLMNLQIFWRPTSLFNTLAMWGMLAAGLGMVFRSLRAAAPAPPAR
jgi:uncharacterized protein